MKGLVFRWPVGLESQLYIPYAIFDGQRRDLCVSSSMKVDLSDIVKKVRECLKGASRAYTPIREVDVPADLLEYLQKRSDLERERNRYEPAFRSLFFGNRI